MYTFRNETLPERLTFDNSLATLYGIGPMKASVLKAKCGFSSSIKLYNLNSYEFDLVAFLLRDFLQPVEKIKRVELRRIDMLKDLKTYHGLRHKLLLPVRGQRTRTNASTRKAQRVVKK